MRTLVEIARGLPSASSVARQTVLAAVFEHEMLAEASTVEQLEAAEQRINAACIEWSKVGTDVRSLRDTVRLRLLRMDAPGWTEHHGSIIKDVDLISETSLQNL